MKTADQFGFKAVASASIEMFDRQMRGSGRTARLLDIAEDGDLIVCSSEEERRHYERRLREQEVQATVIVIKHNRIDGALLDNRRGRLYRRVHYSHSFVMDYFLRVLADAGEWLVEVQERHSHEEPEDPIPAVRYEIDL